jgi:hypothetical protein
MNTIAGILLEKLVPASALACIVLMATGDSSAWHKIATLACFALFWAGSLVMVIRKSR